MDPRLRPLYLWPTALFSVAAPEDLRLCERARAAILAERAVTPSMTRSNRGPTWHGPPDLAVRPDPLWRAVIAHIMGGVGAAAEAFVARAGAPMPPLRPTVQAWAMVLDPGGAVVVHDHADADWSVVWYVDAGDDPEGGELGFTDVRRVRSPVPGIDADPSLLQVRPSTGELLVFPGWLPHFVASYQGTRPRIAVAANVRYLRD